MDKLQLAIEFSRCIYKSGHKPKIDEVFDFVDALEREAFKRGLVVSTVCGKCGSEIRMVDLTTQGNPAWRVFCDCTSGVGCSKSEAYANYVEVQNES